MGSSATEDRTSTGGSTAEEPDWHCMDCGANGFGNYRDHACNTLDHQAAIDAIVGVLGVTVLSYQEAIEGYLKLRGMECLMMTDEQLRQSFIDDGEDPDEIVARQRAMIARLIANRSPAAVSQDQQDA